MSKRKLAPSEEKVLQFLYQHREDPVRPTKAQIAAGADLSISEATNVLTSLEERGMIRGRSPSLLNNAAAILKQIDPNFKPTDSGYNEHVVLLASFLSRADEAFLADELGFEPEFVATVGSRLRAAGTWAGDQLSDEAYGEWMKPDGGAISLWLDGAVACGDLMVTGRDAEGSRLFQMTPGAKRTVEAIMRGSR